MRLHLHAASRPTRARLSRAICAVCSPLCLRLLLLLLLLLLPPPSLGLSWRLNQVLKRVKASGYFVWRGPRLIPYVNSWVPPHGPAARVLFLRPYMASLVAQHTVANARSGAVSIYPCIY